MSTPSTGGLLTVTKQWRYTDRHKAVAVHRPSLSSVFNSLFFQRKKAMYSELCLALIVGF